MGSSSGPKATWAGRVRRAGIRRWARRDAMMAGRLCVTLGGRSKGYAGGPAAAAGRSCVSPGCIAVNKQCFKLQAEGSQSAAAERLSAWQSVKGL